MRRLEYWKIVEIEGKPWFKFHLLPTQTITDDHPIFDDILKWVRRSGFKYRVIETTEKIIEGEGA